MATPTDIVVHSPSSTRERSITHVQQLVKFLIEHGVPLHITSKKMAGGVIVSSTSLLP